MYILAGWIASISDQKMATKFINKQFMLQTRAGLRLFQGYAAAEPIFDFHCHLPPQDIAEDRQFKNLAEIWLEGDHYKWRAMRANGVAETYCTGPAEPFAKFRAWAATVPHTLRNPLYHWTHLELKRYFGIDELLDEASAARIWKKANEQLADPALSARGILKKFKVKAVCTTDDPVDDLRHHDKIAADGFAVRVCPTFRPDKGLAVDQLLAFNGWIARLEKATGGGIATLQDFLAALRQRHQYFHVRGCRMSDHGLSQCFASPVRKKRRRRFSARPGAGRRPRRRKRPISGRI